MISEFFSSAFSTELGKKQNQIKTLTTELEKKKQRRDYLETAPMNNKHLSEYLCECVDLQASQWSARLKQGANLLRDRPFREPRNYLVLENYGGMSKAGVIAPVNIYGIFRTAINEAITSEVMSWPQPEYAGPSLAERKSEIETLNGEILSLESKLQTMRADIETVKRSLEV